jgi:hypothetical protein
MDITYTLQYDNDPTMSYKKNGHQRQKKVSNIGIKTGVEEETGIPHFLSCN